MNHEQFAVHKLNEDGLEKAIFIQNAYNDLLDKLLTVCADCRELSLVKTKLEEACFYSKKSMAINLINQV